MRFQIVIEIDNPDDPLIVNNLTYEQVSEVRALVGLMVNVSGYTVHKIPFDSPLRVD